MKYQPAINVYEGDTLTQLISGELVLPVGQWIRCGQGPCSRWCGVTSTGTLVAAHPAGREGVTIKRFKQLIAYWRPRRAV